MNKSDESSPVREDLACKSENTPSPAYQAKLQALDKVNISFSECNEAFSKLKQAYQVYKTKSFFFPQQEFTKLFGEHLKQTEGELQGMGNLLKKEVGDKFPSKSLPVPLPTLNAADPPLLPSSTPDHSDIPGKNSSVGGITPPASEVGSEEILARNLENTQGGTKRKTRLSSESPQKSKRPKRNLIDAYLIKDKDASKKEGEEEDDEEEEEFEVQSILDLKKSQGSYLYHVTWKGYDPDDYTWEPSTNLTSCEELLVDFFKTRLKKRDEEDPKSEDLTVYLHYDPSIKDTIRKAVFEHLCEPSREDYKNVVAQVIACKTFSQKPADVDELVEKAVIARKRDRYQKYMKMIQEDRLMGELKGKREHQLAELRKWERMINSICSDPAKLCVENNVDLELPPMDFKYINECLAGEGVTLPSDPPLGCECDDCSTSKSCCASQMGSWTPYNKFGRLRISLGTPIYECNKRCSCGPNCSSRVVQKGRNISLCIFRTANGRGWGVKAMENIKKDSLVTEYVGEVISSEEAERRGQIYDAQNCTYLFDLDYNKGDQNPYTVDAAKCGNVSHFINHSCDPNLVVFNVWVNCLDPDLPRLALFASQDIKKGEELTFDYNSGLEAESNALRDLKADECTTPEKGKDLQDLPSELLMKTPKGNRGLQYGKTVCKCGAANCRQYFF